jgi:hypothetical protein
VSFLNSFLNADQAADLRVMQWCSQVRGSMCSREDARALVQRQFCDIWPGSCQVGSDNKPFIPDSVFAENGGLNGIIERTLDFIESLDDDDRAALRYWRTVYGTPTDDVELARNTLVGHYCLAFPADCAGNNINDARFQALGGFPGIERVMIERWEKAKRPQLPEPVRPPGVTNTRFTKTKPGALGVEIRRVTSSETNSTLPTGGGSLPPDWTGQGAEPGGSSSTKYLVGGGIIAALIAGYFVFKKGR